MSLAEASGEGALAGRIDDDRRWCCCQRRQSGLSDRSLDDAPVGLQVAVGHLPRPEVGLHVTAAALASENKSLAHPASVDSLPTSANQEDHVSMATFAARRLQPMLRNTGRIVAIELLAAAQGIEFLRPLTSAPVLEEVLRLVRAVSPAMMQDRSLSRDIEAVHRLVEAGDLGHHARDGIPQLHALQLEAYLAACIDTRT